MTRRVKKTIWLRIVLISHIVVLPVFLNETVVADGTDGFQAHFILMAPDFQDGGKIPLKYACSSYSGENLSPGLVWSSFPINTKSFAVIVDDEDCGKGEKAGKHWAVFNIPPSVNQFHEGESVQEIHQVTEGVNYTGRIGYCGPCPRERHTYTFTVYALGKRMPLVQPEVSMNRSQFKKRYSKFILSSATIHGYFTPPSKLVIVCNRLRKKILNRAKKLFH